MSIFSASRGLPLPLKIRLRVLVFSTSSCKTLTRTSAASGRFAVELSARRLSLIESRQSDSTFSNESFLSTVILSYGSACMLDRAISIFQQIPLLCSAPPTTLSFNALLSSAIRSGHHSQVPNLFSLLSQQHSIPPDRLSYGILVKSLCLSRKLDNAFAVLREMEEKGIEVTTVIYTTLINSLYREGRPERAEEVWNEMVEKGRNPDLTSYNVKIMHQSMNGRLEDVLESISDLKAAGLKPDRITYNSLMTCYSGKNGRYEDVKQVYQDLKSSGFAPNSTTFRVMMKLVCEKGDFDAGFDVFKESMEFDEIPDFVTVRALVVGLAKRAKLEEAIMVVRVVRERFPVDMVGGWKIVEKELGLDVDDKRVAGLVDAVEGPERTSC